MNLNRINNLYNQNAIYDSPVTPDEREQIETLCMNKVDFERLYSKNGPKNRPKYIANKTSELLTLFEDSGGRKDFTISNCFKQTLQRIVPQALSATTFIPSLEISQQEPIITDDDWLAAAEIIKDTPDQFFGS
jgi:hypothetical protein